MPIRFGKSIRLGKNFRLNLSKGGIGASVGVGGLRVGTGPRGNRISATVPGTGLSYYKTTKSSSNKLPQSLPSSAPAKVSQIPSPGLFAPSHEKDFVKAMNFYRAGDTNNALPHFLQVAQKDACGLIFSAVILAKQEGKESQAIDFLERIIQSDAEFPTNLMKKYIASAHIQISITKNVTANVPFDGLGVALILAELYQDQNQIDKAISLLEEIEIASEEPAITLSLCELYSKQNFWDAIIDRAKETESEDDITLETLVYYGRAMQEKGLRDAAISVFTKAVARKKERNPILLLEAKYSRAMSYKSTGKNSQANRAFQEIFAEKPDFKDVKMLLEGQ